MNPQHITYLRNLYRQLKMTERRTDLQPDTMERMTRELRRDLNLARKYQPPVKPIAGKNREFTVFYGEYDIFDNLEVVGEDYIWQMYRDSPPLIWQTAFLNKRIFKLPNCFYSALDDDIHFYIPTDSGQLAGISHDWKTLRKTATNCLGDDDLDYTAPLHYELESAGTVEDPDGRPSTASSKLNNPAYSSPIFSTSK